jgi:hypothetical protein
VHASLTLDTIILINSNFVPLDVCFLGTVICTKGSSVWTSLRVVSIFLEMSSLMNLFSLLPPYIPRLAPAIIRTFSFHRPQVLGMIVFLILLMFILYLCLPTAICSKVQPELPNPENGVNFQADFPTPGIAVTHATVQAPSGDLIGGVGLSSGATAVPGAPTGSPCDAPGVLPTAPMIGAPSSEATTSLSNCAPTASPILAPALLVSEGDLPGPSAPESGVLHESASASMPGFSVPPLPSPRKTRSMHGIVKPKVFKDGTIRYANLTASSEPYKCSRSVVYS